MKNYVRETFYSYLLAASTASQYPALIVYKVHVLTNPNMGLLLDCALLYEVTVLLVKM